MQCFYLDNMIQSIQALKLKIKLSGLEMDDMGVIWLTVISITLNDQEI